MSGKTSKVPRQEGRQLGLLAGHLHGQGQGWRSEVGRALESG